MTKPVRRRTPLAAVAVAWISLLTLQSIAQGDSASAIRKICATRWSGNANAQQICEANQSASATELIKRIESANENAPAFVAARTCIEKFRLQPPEGVDWVQALGCFNERVGEERASGDRS